MWLHSIQGTLSRQSATPDKSTSWLKQGWLEVGQDKGGTAGSRRTNQWQKQEPEHQSESGDGTPTFT